MTPYALYECRLGFEDKWIGYRGTEYEARKVARIWVQCHEVSVIIKRETLLAHYDANGEEVPS